MPRKSNNVSTEIQSASVVVPNTLILPEAVNNKQTQQEDQALKNINYKNMLLTGNYGMLKPDVVTHPNIDAILENEKNTNKSDPWNKLDKSAKVIKLKDFANRHGKEQELTDRESNALYQFLLSNLEQKKLVRAKDVIYDKVTGSITSIPCLLFNSVLKKFTLKRCDKRQSTLKSLAPTGMSKKRKMSLKSSGVGSNVVNGSSGCGDGKGYADGELNNDSTCTVSSDGCSDAE